MLKFFFTGDILKGNASEELLKLLETLENEKEDFWKSQNQKPKQDTHVVRIFPLGP